MRFGIARVESRVMHDPVSEHASPSKAIVVDQAAASDDSSGVRHALLAIIVGVAIVAFGGGGIPTARGYWDVATAPR
jgi:hypothetical protein